MALEGAEATIESLKPVVTMASLDLPIRWPKDSGQDRR